MTKTTIAALVFTAMMTAFVLAISTSAESAIKYRLTGEVTLTLDGPLAGADLRNRNLEYADLTDTNLLFANLPSANLAGANLKYAEMTGANLKGAIGIH